MAYIGRNTDKISNIEVLDNITFDGSSSYSITKSSVAFVPNSAQSCLISIDGVVQATNFTVSTSTIDFGVAIAGTSTCDFFLHYGTGVAFIPTDGSVTSAKLSYPLTTFSSTGIDDNATSTAITIDSSERVGIGTSPHPNSKLNVRTSNDRNLYIRDGYNTVGGIALQTVNNAESANVPLEINADSETLLLSGTPITFTNSGTERMRIDSSGGLLVGKTVGGTISTKGFQVYQTGETNITRDGGNCLFINRLTTDGNLVNFYQATSLEGNIAVSGATVSYNGFTGTHWSRFIDNSTPNILRGTVLETLDEMCDWYNLEFDITTTTQDEDGNDVTETHTEIVPHVLADGQSVGDVITYNHEETDVQATIVKEGDVKHMMSKVSDNSDAKNVYGVFIDYDNDGEGYNDFYVASVGSFVVRIKANEKIAKGDLLQSNGDGTAKVQTDDAVRSSSFAKVLSTTIIETYEDGSYLVPCSLMC
jgi:hypothetical protein